MKPVKQDQNYNGKFGRTQIRTSNSCRSEEKKKMLNVFGVDPPRPGVELAFSTTPDKICTLNITFLVT